MCFMAIDWDLVARLVPPTLGVLVGFVLNRVAERRSKLIAYLSHSSAFRVPLQGQPPMQIHTHAIVIRNTGKKTATNVRVPHFFLPDSFTLWPSVPYTVENVANDCKDIVLPSLAAGQQVTINYLYGPAIFVTNINDAENIRSDEGLARVISVLPTPMPSKWWVRTWWALTLLGAFTAAYVIALAIRALYRLLG